MSSLRKNLIGLLWWLVIVYHKRFMKDLSLVIALFHHYELIWLFLSSDTHGDGCCRRPGEYLPHPHGCGSQKITFPPPEIRFMAAKWRHTHGDGVKNEQECIFSVSSTNNKWRNKSCYDNNESWKRENSQIFAKYGRTFTKLQR